MKYSNYIALSPHYESVVDIDSEHRNPNLWKEYVVHEDMVNALEKICATLKYEAPDQRRSFWIHGAYGTGKSYAGIVLKHLFEDSIDNVTEFLSKTMLVPYRERFLAFREKGEFLVIWKSQTQDIRDGTQLIMTMEAAIREKLAEKFGDKAYYGRKSLISAAKDAVRDESINWRHIFNSGEYDFDMYGSFDDFREDVMKGSIAAANLVARIFRSKGFGLFDSLTKFKEWIADIIEGNHLQKTGIVFIWDEFTAYVRNNPNDDVLQPLSEFCKEQPFFMFLIVHKAESWVKQMGEDVYERIIHRFHSLNFHVSENAAYDLIGGSIMIRPGMTEQWNAQADILMKSVAKSIPEFDTLDMSDKRDKLRKLCPLHPMTLSLLAIVAQNFGAAQRTIFRFMKDAENSENDSGFVYFINNFGPDGWRWLTPDFLWDYFFTRESDVRSFSPEAQKAYQHYRENYERISGEYHMHVFKAAMLLIAVMSTGSVSNLYSRAVQRRVAATRNTLYRCFAGQMTPEDINQHLADLEAINVIRLDDMSGGMDKRLQIPYSSGTTDVFSVRKGMLAKKYTRYELFKKNGDFAKSIEAKLWDKNRASAGRMIIAACDSGTTSINARLGELQAELKRYPYKFGILAIVISEQSQFTGMYDKVKALAAQDTTGRCAVYLLKGALTEGHLDRWYNAMTHAGLAGDEGKSGDKTRYEDEANTIIEEWSASAADDQIMAVCGKYLYPAEYGAAGLVSKIEKGILFGSVFTSAPELVVQTVTVFKRNTQTAVLSGIQKTAPTALFGYIKNGLQKAGVWDIDSLEKLAHASGNETASAVGRLAKFVLERFSQGTRIRLDALWQELQAAPYGCYNCMACGYILGFVMRHYVNSQFTWNKGDNNTHLLTEQNLSAMISAMLREETVNNYLSPGSEVWQKFKPYVQKIFRLSDSEAVNEIEAKKYMSKKCTESGVPFWVLKYADAENFGGHAAKSTACEIVEMFYGFMNDSGDSEQLMNDITAKFAGLGSLRNTIGDLYFEHGAAFEAFSMFITEKCPELQDLREKIGLSGRDLFDGVRQMMQGEISTWTENQVQDRLSELCLEYRAIAVLNDALNLQRKSIRLIGEDIANALSSMKIPGTVIGKMGYEWYPALRAMRDIAVTQWNRLPLNTRAEYVKMLASGAGKAWGCVESSMPILQEYMRVNGHNCTDDELENIYASLKAVGYESPAADFEARINAQLNNMAYTRNKIRLQELWEQQSRCKSVSEWCTHFAVPIQWAVSDEALRHIQTLKAIQDGRTADNTALSSAVQYFESHVVSELTDEEKIRESFFEQIGDTYRDIFREHRDVLISRLKTNPRLTADVYTWANKIGEIRATLDVFLREKYRAEAKMNVQKMSESELRNRVIQLLDENPDLYTLFIN